jgi:RAB6A-GEF complex partner protein 1
MYNNQSQASIDCLWEEKVRIFFCQHLHQIKNDHFICSCQVNVYIVDDVTGGLELSHRMSLSSKDFPGSPGFVREMKWTPDFSAMILCWSTGGISLWSTYGTMLMSSLAWDYGLNADLNKQNPLNILSMDWCVKK